ncbi:MAG: hypothetical protein CVT86_06985, partial [Alphaproteobacteria bacterium HGW-Alphaproteobacteria-8]
MLAITLSRLCLPLWLMASPLMAQEVAPGVAPRPAEDAASDDPHAEPRARLDQLFATLADDNAANPAQIQRRIAEIWSASGSDSMDFLLSRGREALDAEEYDKAVAHLSALIALAPDFAEGWNARATAHFLQDELWLSVADIQRALALEPRHFGALAGLGVILERIGDEAGALR